MRLPRAPANISEPQIIARANALGRGKPAEAKYNSHKAEKRENNLTCSSLAQLHTEGHTFVLEEMETEPVAYDLYFTFHSVVHVRLYVDLKYLVYNNDEQN